MSMNDVETFGNAAPSEEKSQNPPEDPHTSPEEKLRHALRESKKQRQRACGEELQAVLKKHGCRLSPRVTVIDNEITSIVDIIAI